VRACALINNRHFSGEKIIEEKKNDMIEFRIDE
jgi:hypothetical protein